MDDKELAQIGLDAVDRFLAGFNSRDITLWVESLNFPHIRPGAGQANSIIADITEQAIVKEVEWITIRLKLFGE